jgi:hypothetical protein
MPLENIPWAVSGGITSAAQARMLAYQASSGAEGVAGVGDLQVLQLAVAGAAVRVTAGGGIMVNRYPGARNESYMARAGDETTVAVPQNAGGSTRYDLLVLRIDDWNMPGGQATPATLPTNTVAAAKYQLITNVPAATKTAKELNLNYPAIALARLAIPAATSAVTTAMITPLREVAVPRRKRDLRVVAQKAGRDNQLTNTTAGGEIFPNDGQFTVEVPEWATRLRFKADLGGLYVPPGTSDGLIWVQIGATRADMFNAQQVRMDATAPKADAQRYTAWSGDDVAIPKAMRGQSIIFRLVGRKMGGTANFRADAYTAMSLDLEFVEAPSEDV